MATGAGGVFSSIRSGVAAGVAGVSSKTVIKDLDAVSTLCSLALASQLRSSRIGIVDRRITFYSSENQALDRARDDVNRYQLTWLTPPLQGGLVPWVESGNRDVGFFIQHALDALELLQKPYSNPDDPADAAAFQMLESQKDILRKHLEVLNTKALPPLDFKYPLHRVWKASMLSATRILCEYGYNETLKVFVEELRDVIFDMVPQAPNTEIDKSSVFGFAAASMVSLFSREPKKKPDIDCITMMLALLGNNFLPANTKIGFVNGRLKYYPPINQSSARTYDNVSSDDLGHLRPCLSNKLDYWMERRNPVITHLLNETIKSLTKLQIPYKNSTEPKDQNAVGLLESCKAFIKDRSERVQIIEKEEIVDRSNPPFCSLELIEALTTIYDGKFQRTLSTFVSEQWGKYAAGQPVNPNKPHRAVTPAAAGTSPTMMALSSSPTPTPTPTPPNTPLSPAALAAAPAPVTAVSAAATAAAGTGT